MSNANGCGSAACGCAAGAALDESSAPTHLAVDVVDLSRPPPVPQASVNGVPLHVSGQRPDDATLRQLACSELLRQAAVQAGLLDAADEPGAALSEAASAAIEALLERELALPEPSEDVCRRHHAAHAARYSSGERVRARHVLFAVTPGVDVVALRQRAERSLLDLRCHDGDAQRADAAFAKAAAELSNCPSGAEGGSLGWLRREDCAPEFARELFASAEIGVLPRLVHSRFGLHVVEVQQREAGVPQPFETVQSAVAQTLRQQTYVSAMRQYLSLLAGQAELVGVPLEGSDSPLVQ